MRSGSGDDALVVAGDWSRCRTVRDDGISPERSEPRSVEWRRRLVVAGGWTRCRTVRDGEGAVATSASRTLNRKSINRKSNSVFSVYSVVNLLPQPTTLNPLKRKGFRFSFATPFFILHFSFSKRKGFRFSLDEPSVHSVISVVNLPLNSQPTTLNSPIANSTCRRLLQWETENGIMRQILRRERNVKWPTKQRSGRVFARIVNVLT